MSPHKLNLIQLAVPHTHMVFLLYNFFFFIGLFYIVNSGSDIRNHGNQHIIKDGTVWAVNIQYRLTPHTSQGC